MDELKYFWDDLIKHQPDKLGWMRGREYIKYKLADDHSSINLLDLYGAFIETFIPDAEGNIEFVNKENREKFFTYLSQLLQQKKLKAIVRELELREATEEEQEKYAKIQGKPSIENFVALRSNNDYISPPISPEKIVGIIREKWNSYSNNRAREDFERWGVFFTLPENKW